MKSNMKRWILSIVAIVLCAVLVFETSPSVLASGLETIASEATTAVEAVVEVVAEEAATEEVTESTTETTTEAQEEVTTETATEATTELATATTEAGTVAENITTEATAATESATADAVKVTEKDTAETTVTDEGAATEVANVVEKQQLLKYEDDVVIIEVKEIVVNAIPEGVSLNVVPIKADSDLTKEQYKEVEEQLQNKVVDSEYDIAGFLAYDITLPSEKYQQRIRF